MSDLGFLRIRLLAGVGSVLPALLMAMPANAQAGEPPADATADAPAQAGDFIPDIVVTAQKRSESVQSTPLAITAVSGAALRSSGASNVDALASSVPNLMLGQTYGTANLALRGISLNTVNFAGENPIAFHMDGVYIQRPASVLASFYDMERVEVLRGAQGTLYGRNATGGSLNLITSNPTKDLSGYFQATVGNYNHVAFEGAISGPLIEDRLLVRLAVRTDDRGGLGKNLVTGHDIDDLKERSIRLKLDYRPTERLSILLAADYSRSDDHQTPHFGNTAFGSTPLGLVLFPGSYVPTNVRDVAAEEDPFRRNRFWGVQSTISYELADEVALKSLTAYRRVNAYAYGDLDQTSAAALSPAVFRDNARQFSQEFQLTGNMKRSKWIFGLYYFHETDNGAEPVAFTTALLPLLGGPTLPAYRTLGYYSGSQIKTDAYAAFGQYTYSLTDTFDVTLGARYSIERKEAINQGKLDLITAFDRAIFDGTPTFGPNVNPLIVSIQCAKGLPTLGYANPADCQPSKTFKAFTPKIGVEFKPAPGVLLYASYSKGFKSGVYNFGAPAGAVDPEKIDDYEAGIKSTLFGGMLRANLAGFYYDYTNLQVNKVVVTNVLVENAASARVYGLEAEITARPLPGLQFDFSGAYLHAKFRDFVSADPLRPGGDGVTVDNHGQAAFNLSGNTLPQAPEWSGKFGAAYTLTTGVGDFTLRGEAIYTDKLYFTPFNIANASVSARTRFNASLVYEGVDKHLYASLNAKNLANKVKVTNGFVTTALTGGVINAYLEQPFTIDLTVGYRF